MSTGALTRLRRVQRPEPVPHNTLQQVVRAVGNVRRRLPNVVEYRRQVRIRWMTLQRAFRNVIGALTRYLRIAVMLSVCLGTNADLLDCRSGVCIESTDLGPTTMKIDGERLIGNVYYVAQRFDGNGHFEYHTICRGQRSDCGLLNFEHLGKRSADLHVRPSTLHRRKRVAEVPTCGGRRCAANPATPDHHAWYSIRPTHGQLKLLGNLVYVLAAVPLYLLFGLPGLVVASGLWYLQPTAAAFINVGTSHLVVGQAGDVFANTDPVNPWTVTIKDVSYTGQWTLEQIVPLDYSTNLTFATLCPLGVATCPNCDQVRNCLAVVQPVQLTILDGCAIQTGGTACATVQLEPRPHQDVSVWRRSTDDLSITLVISTNTGDRTVEIGSSVGHYAIGPNDLNVACHIADSARRYYQRVAVSDDADEAQPTGHICDVTQTDVAGVLDAPYQLEASGPLHNLGRFIRWNRCDNERCHYDGPGSYDEAYTRFRSNLHCANGVIKPYDIHGTRLMAPTKLLIPATITCDVAIARGAAPYTPCGPDTTVKMSAEGDVVRFERQPKSDCVISIAAPSGCHFERTNVPDGVSTSLYRCAQDTTFSVAGTTIVLKATTYSTALYDTAAHYLHRARVAAANVASNSIIGTVSGGLKQLEKFFEKFVDSNLVRVTTVSAAAIGGFVVLGPVGGAASGVLALAVLAFTAVPTMNFILPIDGTTAMDLARDDDPICSVSYLIYDIGPQEFPKFGGRYHHICVCLPRADAKSRCAQAWYATGSDTAPLQIGEYNFGRGDLTSHADDRKTRLPYYHCNETNIFQKPCIQTKLGIKMKQLKFVTEHTTQTPTTQRPCPTVQCPTYSTPTTTSTSVVPVCAVAVAVAFAVGNVPAAAALALLCAATAIRGQCFGVDTVVDDFAPTGIVVPNSTVPCLPRQRLCHSGRNVGICLSERCVPVGLQKNGTVLSIHVQRVGFPYSTPLAYLRTGHGSVFDSAGKFTHVVLDIPPVQGPVCSCHGQFELRDQRVGVCVNNHFARLTDRSKHVDVTILGTSLGLGRMMFEFGRTVTFDSWMSINVLGKPTVMPTVDIRCDWGQLYCVYGNRFGVCVDVALTERRRCVPVRPAVATDELLFDNDIVAATYSDTNRRTSSIYDGNFSKEFTAVFHTNINGNTSCRTVASVCYYGVYGICNRNNECVATDSHEPIQQPDYHFSVHNISFLSIYFKLQPGRPENLLYFF